MSEQTMIRETKPWVTWALIAVVVCLFVISLIAASGAEFGGTDALATEILESDGAEPWFSPLFEPAGEVESGLFALQAAIGAGLLGYVFGIFRGRSQRP